jgi:type VI secretion system protein ImpJ
MNTPLPIVWSEGLYMVPQHLQQQDQYVEYLVRSRVSAIFKDCWGVTRLSIDNLGLQRGQVALEAFEGIMPDGLPLNLTSATLPPPRPFDDHFPPIKSSLDLFLAVPRVREGVANVAADPDPRVRWYRTTRHTHDLLGEAEAQEVEYAHPSVMLIFEDEPREGYDVIKIAEVVRNEGGSYALSDTYIPPCLQIATIPFLMSSLRRLLSSMTTRREVLAQAQSERGDSTLEYNASDVTRFLLMSSINTYIPVIDHFVESGDLPPRALYLALVQLVGQLSMFVKDFDPTTVPKFIFTDMRNTFEPLFAMITYMLHATVEEHFLAIRLDPRDDGMHLAQIEDVNIPRCSKYLLGVRSPVNEDEARAKLPRLSKIASWQDVNGIVAAATPGAPVQSTYRPPPEIPVKTGVVYFTIDTSNQYWTNIMLERRIAVYLPAPFASSETSIELLGVLDRKRRGKDQDKR